MKPVTFGRNMKIRDFVKPELDYFRENCNFSSQELEYFDLRANDMSNVQIALAMHISESQVSKLAKRVKLKMLRVL